MAEAGALRALDYHFSIDDVLGALVEASHGGGGLFSQPFFAELAALHRRFGCSIDLYLFFRGRVDARAHTLEEISDRLRADFERTPWLRLGPHALDYETAPYAQTAGELEAALTAIYREIDRFAGRRARARWLRLHYFSEAFEQAAFLREQGVEALLLTDKEAVSYRLPPAPKAELERTGRVRHLGLELIRSAPRLEHLAHAGATDREVVAALDEKLERERRVALFTHEIDFATPRVREILDLSLTHLKRAGAVSR